MADPTPATETDTRLENAKKKFVDKLREIFQFDAADLDFGIYRVLNMRRDALDKFLRDDLMRQVEASLKDGQSLTREALEAEKAKIEESLYALGVKDFASVPRWVELKAKLDAIPDTSTLAREVFSDLTTFFARYYEDGDFMALPRYKADTYAIPYDGSEVKLHWANADQYYVKSTEVFGNYRVKLDGFPGNETRYLNLKLAAAETDRDNNKPSEKRRFVLRAETPYTIDGRELTVWLEWKAAAKEGAKGSQKQEELNEGAATRILKDESLPADWKLALAKKASQDAKRPVAEQRSALEFQLYRYTRKQSSDYFIHKDLGGFLRRELDFYIKNEVLLLDDVESMDEAAFAIPLRKVRAMRAVALKIITWLAQVEDFQKRLFLKKKFVIKTGAILSQHEFRHQPDRAFTAKLAHAAKDMAVGDADLSSLPVELGVATADRQPAVYLSSDSISTQRLLASLDLPDYQYDGLLIRGENLGALQLLRPTYARRIGAVFIDPPYNTGLGDFVYKDQYQHSSWVSMMHDRLSAARELCSSRSSVFATIDDSEVCRLRELLEMVFGTNNFVANVVWQKKYARQNDATWFSTAHDHVLVAAKDKSIWRPIPLPRTEEQMRGYKNPDGDPRGTWQSVVYTCNKTAEERPNLYYPVRKPNGEDVWPERDRVWAYSPETHAKNVAENRIWWGNSGELPKPRLKVFLGELGDGAVPDTLWLREDVGDNQDAQRELADLGMSKKFSTPKPSSLIRRVCELAMKGDDVIDGQRTIIDFFAGSGTTGHAVMKMNRADQRHRHFILIESGDHFETVLVPRILKATYASEWRDGKPVKVDPVKALYKIIELESYDDTLENLELKAPAPATQGLLDLNAQAREDYVLRYMLDLESQGSLLDLPRFEKPWSYTIKVRRGGLVETSPVDLVETFNFLLGLHVKSYDTFDQEDLLFVQGVIRAPEGSTTGDQRVLVVWRDCERWPQAELDKTLRRFFGRVSDADKKLPLDEFHAIYVNGDHHLDNLVADGQVRILPIEETFHRLMFDTSDEV